MRSASGGFGIAAAVLLISGFAPADPASARQASSITDRAAQLRPGQYVWQPGQAATGEVEIVVSLPLQRAYVYRGGELIGVSTVSTGREGYETPAGSYTILGKEADHHSNRYDDAPMPYMQRLTWDGIALHGGAIPGQPASHGCVRLPLAFARLLFGATELGAAVHVTEQAPSSPREALALVRGAGDDEGMGGPEDESGAGD